MKTNHKKYYSHIKETIMLDKVLSTLLPNVKDVIRTFIPDPTKAAEAEAKLNEILLNHENARMKAQRDVIVAEAKGESWLQRNWRPLTMLTFVAIIISYAFGWTSPDLDKDIVGKMFDIMQIGIGGYIIGRSAEKAAPSVAKLFNK